MSQPIVHGDAFTTYVRSVRLALEEKGVPHKFVTLDLVKGQHKGQEHRVRHPWGKMPAFEHDGKASIGLCAPIAIPSAALSGGGMGLSGIIAARLG